MDDEPTTEILEATFRALRERGYADLTMKDIATESSLSTGSIHYYYGNKQNLLEALLDFLYERHVDQLDSVMGTTYRERLLSLAELLLSDVDGRPGIAFRTAVLSVQAQAPFNDTVRAKIVEFDTAVFERFRVIIAAGIESGEFDEDIDPTIVSEFLATMIAGAHTRQVAVGRSLDPIYDALVDYVEDHLADGHMSRVTS